MLDISTGESRRTFTFFSTQVKKNKMCPVVPSEWAFNDMYIYNSPFQTGQSDRFPNQVATVLRFLLVVSGTAKRCLLSLVRSYSHRSDSDGTLPVSIGTIRTSRLERKHSSRVDRWTFFHHSTPDSKAKQTFHFSPVTLITLISWRLRFPTPKKEKPARFPSGLLWASWARSAVQLECFSIHAGECLTSAALFAEGCFPRAVRRYNI